MRRLIKYAVAICVLVLVGCSLGNNEVLYKSSKLGLIPTIPNNEEADLSEVWSEADSMLSKTLNLEDLGIANFYKGPDVEIYKVGCPSCAHVPYAYFLVINAKETFLIQDYTNESKVERIVMRNIKGDSYYNKAHKDSLILETWHVVVENKLKELRRGQKPF